MRENLNLFSQFLDFFQNTLNVKEHYNMNIDKKWPEDAPLNKI